MKTKAKEYAHTPVVCAFKKADDIKAASIKTDYPRWLKVVGGSKEDYVSSVIRALKDQGYNQTRGTMLRWIRAAGIRLREKKRSDAGSTRAPAPAPATKMTKAGVIRWLRTRSKAEVAAIFAAVKK